MKGTFTKTYDHVMRDHNLPLLDRVIYCRLARFTENNKSAFPTQQWLAEEFGTNEQQVYRSLKRLKDAGLIESKQRGLSKSNVYKVNEWSNVVSNEVLKARKSRNETLPDEEESRIITHDEPESSPMMNPEPSPVLFRIITHDEHSIQEEYTTLEKQDFNNESLDEVEEKENTSSNSEYEIIIPSTVSILSSVSHSVVDDSNNSDPYYISPEKVADFMKNMKYKKLSQESEELY